jgi:hypothetical protein
MVGKIVLDELKFNNPAPHSKYYRADLSVMREVERLTDEIIKDVKDKGGIDYLILSAGGPPTGTWKKSPEAYYFSDAGIDIREWKKLLWYRAYHGTLGIRLRFNSVGSTQPTGYYHM